MLTPIQIQFGQPKTLSPEIFIEFNNYYQDITQGGSLLGNLTLVNGEELFDVNQRENIFNDLGWEWRLNNELVTTIANPTIADIKGTYSGIQWLECKVTHLPSGLVFTRGKWSYLQYNDLEDVGAELYVPEGQTPPANALSVFEPWYPDYYVPYDNAFYDNDYDRNGIVTASDLTQYLANYVPPLSNRA